MKEKLNIKSIPDLSRLLGIGEGVLWRLAKNVDRHYRCWDEPKKNKPGEVRKISAPVGELKRTQKALHKLLASKCDLGSFSHYGRKGCSNITNAMVHAGEKIVFTCDLRDFFPSVRPERVVKSLIAEQGCSKDVAVLIAKLVTYKFQLPQGAATSTDIANIITMRLQRRLGCLARQWGLKFSILGDDITFSGNFICDDFVKRVRRIIKDEGFKIHPTKGGTFTKSERQMVTGINVAHGLSVRQEMRSWKAEFHRKSMQELAGNICFEDADKARKRFCGQMSYVRSVRKKSISA